MHIRLSREFSDLNEVDLRSHANVLDRLLHIHLSKNHLLCLTPSEVLKLRAAIQFGPQAQHALNIIARKSQDYIASSNRSDVNLILLPTGSAKREMLGREVFVRTEDIHQWLERDPFLYVENGITDGSIYKFIVSAAIKEWLGTAALIWIKPFHGGGDTLAGAMAVLIGSAIQGVCVVDRDSSSNVPPFPGDTGSKVHKELIRIGVIDSTGASINNPFFALMPTFGWGLENYISPHMLEVFFEENPQSSSRRGEFIDIFPNFPKLSDDEWNAWWTMNLKSISQDAGLLAAGFKQRFGAATGVEVNYDKLAALSIPDSVVGFVASSAEPSRFHRALSQALSKDLKADPFRMAVESLARRAHSIFAADAAIGFA